MQHTLTARDKRFLFICAIIAAASLWVGVKYFYKAFPEASVEFAVSQDQAYDIATKFLSARGADIGAYRHAGIFTFDDSVKTFLEKDMGLEEATPLMGSRLRMWRWANRWYVPLQKEEYSVEVTTSGEVVGFEHLIAEGQDGASLDKAAARAKAEDFLANVMHRDPAALEFVEDMTQQRPKRMDYTFTWKERDWSHNGASHRVSVEIHGDQVGAYSDFVHVPESWMRSYRELRAQNGTASAVDGFFMALLVIGMVVVFIQNLRRKDIRWRAALIFGGITAVLTFLSTLNAFSLVEYSYRTTDTYASFILARISIGLVGAIFQGLAIAFMMAAGESLYREHFPGLLAVPNYFRRRTIRTKSFLIGVSLGLTLTCFFFAYQTIFYLCANALGAWSPADVPFDNVVNTKLPWVFVLIGGLFPALSEEFIFRLFGIPFLQRLLKQRWLAIVLAAFIWGFGHAGYPNQPFYIRGLEVGIAGVIIGVIMIRYGILATLVWHYTVDALYSALLLLRSGNAYYVGSGAVSAGIMLIPLAVAIVLYLRAKSFAPEDDLSNAGEGVAPPLPPPEIVNVEPAVRYAGMGSRQVVFGLVVAVAAVAFTFIPVKKVGEDFDIGVTQAAAEASAIAFVRDHGVEPAAWRVVTHAEGGRNNATEYILEHGDVTTLNTVYGKQIQPVRWQTRFFKILEREEWEVYINTANGSVDAFTHIVAEDTPGAMLEKDSALAIAQAYLRMRGVDLNGFVVKEAKSEDRKARRDHIFTFEAAPGSPMNVDQTMFRREVTVAGSEITRDHRFMKVPEEWTREREQSTVITAIHTSLKVGIVAALILFALWLFVKAMRSGNLQWKPALKLGVLCSFGAAIGVLLSLNTFYDSYATTMTMEQYITIQSIGFVMLCLGLPLLVVVTAAFTSTLYPSQWSTLRGAGLRARARDGALAAIIFAGCSYGMKHAEAMLLQAFPAALGTGGVAPPEGISTMFPAWQLVAGAALGALMSTAGTGIVLHIALREIKKMNILVPAVIVAVLIFMIPDHGTPVNAVVRVLYGFLTVAAMVALIRWVLRDNIVAYIAAFFVWGCVEAGLNYASLSAPLYRWTGYGILGVAGITLAFLWLRAEKTVRAAS